MEGRLKPNIPPQRHQEPALLWCCSRFSRRCLRRCRPPRKRPWWRLLWPRPAEPSASFQIQHAWKVLQELSDQPPTRAAPAICLKGVRVGDESNMITFTVAGTAKSLFSESDWFEVCFSAFRCLHGLVGTQFCLYRLLKQLYFCNCGYIVKFDLLKVYLGKLNFSILLWNEPNYRGRGYIIFALVLFS